MLKTSHVIAGSITAAVLVILLLGLQSLMNTNRSEVPEAASPQKQEVIASSTREDGVDEISTSTHSPVDTVREDGGTMSQQNTVLPAQYSESFSFAVEADPHMDEKSDPQVFRQTLQNIITGKPAFLIDLGDIFMVDKLGDKSDSNIRERYTTMKAFYDMLPSSIPLYFAMGNHDGEVGWDSFNTKQYRREYFPEQTFENNYYSFTKDNALFIVLDPYTYTIEKPNTDGWLWTLGKVQYDWLKTTLEKSNAQRKFVFIHQLVGGDNQGRGGVEFAKLYEWGGDNTDGTYGFDAKRPGWGEPIHKLLVDNKVDAVFKGHDHFYSKQELDGLIYQTVPQPSHPGDKVNTAEEYGYVSGETIGGSGHVSVRVSTSTVTVEFVQYDGKVVDRYVLP